MSPAKVTLPGFTSGDTWNGFTFGPVSPSPAYAVVSATLTFKNVASPGASAAYVAGTAPGSKGTLVINNAASYVISAPKQQLPLKPGDYVGRLQTVDSHGTKKSYVDIYLSVS